MTKKYYVVYEKKMDACYDYLAGACRGKKVKYHPLKLEKKSEKYVKNLQRSRIKQETMRDYNAWIQDGFKLMAEEFI